MFWALERYWVNLIVSKLKSVQKQEAHVGPVKRLKTGRYQDIYFCVKHSMCAQIFPKK